MMPAKELSFIILTINLIGILTSLDTSAYGKKCGKHGFYSIIQASKFQNVFCRTKKENYYLIYKDKFAESDTVRFTCNLMTSRTHIPIDRLPDQVEIRIYAHNEMFWYESQVFNLVNIAHLEQHGCHPRIGMPMYEIKPAEIQHSTEEYLQNTKRTIMMDRIPSVATDKKAIKFQFAMRGNKRVDLECLFKTEEGTVISSDTIHATCFGEEAHAWSHNICPPKLRTLPKVFRFPEARPFNAPKLQSKYTCLDFKHIMPIVNTFRLNVLSDANNANSDRSLVADKFGNGGGSGRSGKAADRNGYYGTGDKELRRPASGSIDNAIEALYSKLRINKRQQTFLNVMKKELKVGYD